MGAGARRNPPPLHERVRNLSRIDIAYVERHDRRARRLVKGAVELDLRDFAHASEKAIRQCSFMRRDRLDPALRLDKVETCGKSRDAVTVERARLKARGPLHGLQRIEAVHARAAHGPRRHVNALRHGQPAGPLRTHEPLVASKAHNIEPHGIHVNLRRTSRLRGIDDHQRTCRMGHGRYARNVDRVAGHVGGMRHHHGTRTRRDQPLELVVVEHAVRVAAGMLNGHALLRGQAVERTQHGVVLKHRRDHAIAGAHHAIDDGVERRRGVGRKAHMVRPRATQKARELGTAAMNRTSGIEGTRRGTAPGIAERAHRLRHGIDDRLRLVHGRRRVIQVDHRTTSHMSITVKPSVGTPAAVSSLRSSSSSAGNAFHARPQPAATSPGTGIVRPGRPRSMHRDSHPMAAAVVGNVMTSAGRFSLMATPTNTLRAHDAHGLLHLLHDHVHIRDLAHRELVLNAIVIEAGAAGKDLDALLGQTLQVVEHR